jgi:hypothetical protein
MKHYSLLGRFISYEENKVLGIRTLILSCELVFYYIVKDKSYSFFAGPSNGRDKMFYNPTNNSWETDEVISEELYRNIGLVSIL